VVMTEIADHRHGADSLAIVAATCVLGAQMVLIGHSVPIATGLLILGASLWLLLLYTFLVAMTIKADKPPLVDGISGGWLLTVVATESIAVLLALLSPHWHPPLRLEADVIAVAIWLGGAMLYIWIGSLILYRYLFVRFYPADLTPAHWINMGAMAICALAGSLLVDDSVRAPFLESLRPFIEGFTLLSWATATWWIPLLLSLTVWRYAVGRPLVGCGESYWSGVFPLGMYAVATFQMAYAMSLDFLEVIAHLFFWLSLGAWVVGVIEMARAALKGEASHPLDIGAATRGSARR
jgi:tellurite resistance protein TehA-like permease